MLAQLLSWATCLDLDIHRIYTRFYEILNCHQLTSRAKCQDRIYTLIESITTNTES